jgi:outer membrane lipoprotein
MKLLTALAVALTLTACATAPKPLQGEYSPLLPDDFVNRDAAGERVRWGGRIVSVEPRAQSSCFEIVAMPLGSSGRPLKVDRTEGRFLACRAGFYEPQVFEEGREITIAGRIDGFEMRKVGDYDYRAPRVAADIVYLWPERRESDFRFRPSFSIGWFGHW